MGHSHGSPAEKEGCGGALVVMLLVGAGQLAEGNTLLGALILVPLALVVIYVLAVNSLAVLRETTTFGPFIDRIDHLLVAWELDSKLRKDPPPYQVEQLLRKLPQFSTFYVRSVIGRLMHHPDALVRVVGIEAILVRGSTDERKLVAGRFPDETSENRLTMITLLPTTTDFLPVIKQALSAREQRIRLAGLKKISKMSAVPQGEAVLPLAGDPDPDVREAALDLLTALKFPPAEPFFRSEVASRGRHFVRGLKGLLVLGSTTLAELRSILGDPSGISPELRQIVAQQPSPVVRMMLLGWLGDAKTPSDRQSAGEALWIHDSVTRPRDGEAAPLLALLRRDPHPPTRTMAARLLGLHPFQAVVAALIRAVFEDESDQVTLGAAASLARLALKLPGVATTLAQAPAFQAGNSGRGGAMTEFLRLEILAGTSPTMGRMCPKSQDGEVLEGTSPTMGRLCPKSQDGAVPEGSPPRNPEPGTIPAPESKDFPGSSEIDLSRLDLLRLRFRAGARRETVLQALSMILKLPESEMVPLLEERLHWETDADIAGMVVRALIQTEVPRPTLKVTLSGLVLSHPSGAVQETIRSGMGLLEPPPVPRSGGTSDGSRLSSISIDDDSFY